MKKISYQYLIEELGLTPEQIQEIIIEAQESFGKNLMMIDEALLEKRQLNP
jgi:heme oxygenase